MTLRLRSHPALHVMRIGFAVAAGLLFPVGCGKSPLATTLAPEPIRAETIQVVATVGMVADLVRNVGGPHVRVTQLMGAGVDPHLYKITRDDVRAIFAADVIFASGLMLEGKMSHTLDQMARRRPVVAIADRLAEKQLLPHLPTSVDTDTGSHGHIDPHVWMDMATWSKTLPFIVDALSALKPSASDDFQGRAKEFERSILEIHEYGVRAVATIPESSRHLITSHDAFGYFGEAYGLRVTGVQGVSTDSEAGLLWINQLVDTIVDEKIQAVFVENSVPRKSLEAVIEGVQSRGHRIIIGGELFSDSAGPMNSYEGTYLGMMDHNLTSITRALGGQAPPKGYRDKLVSITPTPTDTALPAGAAK